MDIQSEKIDLAKRLLDTENESIINAVKSVLDSFDSNHEWADLPEKVIKDIKESLDQIRDFVQRTEKILQLITEHPSMFRQVSKVITCHIFQTDFLYQ